MCSDKSLDKSFVDSSHWEADQLSGKSGGEVDRYQLPANEKAKLSLSGSERNSAFVKGSDGKFVNVSGVSGIDLKFDGRSTGIIDIDRNGLPDLVMTNANGPTLSIFQNQIDQLVDRNYFVAVRVVGGNREPKASSQYCSRDAIGALVFLKADDELTMREARCGEGLATQNSRTYIFGLNRSKQAKSVMVRWPSGKETTVTDVPSGNLIEFYENAEETEDGSGVVQQKYAAATERVERAVATPQIIDINHDVDLDQGQIAVYVAMATWCDSCKKHMEDLEQIQKEMAGKVAVFAIPIDAKDSEKALKAYVQKYNPKYELLAPDKMRSTAFLALAAESLGHAEVPFSVVIGKDGRIIEIVSGLPTVSELLRAWDRHAKAGIH